MSAPSTTLSPKQLIAAAKAPLMAYNDKNWDALKASITPNFVYDEVATERKVQGVDNVMPLMKEWGEAIPDSKATFDNAYVSGNTVVIELTWRGTHTGPLNLPSGPVPGTGKRIELRACNVFEITGDKASMQRQYFDMGTMLRQLGIGG
jgi:steroid delta-isomerase-like uncharacterized protein